MKPEGPSRVIRLVGMAILLMTLVVLTDSGAAEPNLKIEVQLIWGTNDAKSPNPRHKPVEPDVLKRLKELPLKWSHYFEENRKNMEIASGKYKKEFLSDKCAVAVKNLGGAQVEVSLIGKGEPVVKQTQDLPRGEALVLGGNAPNATSWLVFIKRTE